MSGPLGGSKSRILACRLPPLQISNITSKPVRSCYGECQTKHFYVKLNWLCCCSHCMGKYIAGVTSSPRSRLSCLVLTCYFCNPGRPWPAKSVWNPDIACTQSVGCWLAQIRVFFTEIRLWSAWATTIAVKPLVYLTWYLEISTQSSQPVSMCSL